MIIKKNIKSCLSYIVSYRLFIHFSALHFFSMILSSYLSVIVAVEKKKEKVFVRKNPRKKYKNIHTFSHFCFPKTNTKK